MDSSLTNKIVAALSNLAVGIAGGIIPLLAAGRHGSHRSLSLANSLAGGIFLGVGFIYLLPEASEALTRISNQGA